MKTVFYYNMLLTFFQKESFVFAILTYKIWSQCSSVGIATRIWDRWLDFDSWEVQDFSPCHRIKTGSGSHPPYCQIGTEGFLIRDKAAGGIKMTTDLHLVWMLRMHGVVSPLLHVFMPWYLIKHQGQLYLLHFDLVSFFMSIKGSSERESCVGFFHTDIFDFWPQYYDFTYVYFILSYVNFMSNKRYIKYIFCCHRGVIALTGPVSWVVYFFSVSL